MPDLTSIAELVRACVALGADATDGFTRDEKALVAAYDGSIDAALVSELRSRIREGHDPLGDAFCRIKSPAQRRPFGQTYTPEAIVSSMIDWAEDQGLPVRVVDPGAGSGRYLLAAARRFPHARVVGSDIDPLATLMLRANLAASGIADSATVTLGDYRRMRLDGVDGPTLFIGNPPYVRHHRIETQWKRWMLATARRRGLDASGLAGLHVHFFLATAEHGRPGDYGAFITSAEWLDVNYGRLVRQLLLDGLGGTALHILEPQVTPFADATTTGAITCFRLGERPSSLRLRRVATVGDLGRLDGGRRVSRQRLAEVSRWSVLTRPTLRLPEGYIELGELCRVHRGTVTGANSVWVTTKGDPRLPESVLYPAVTRARDLFTAGERLTDEESLRRVIDLPVDLDELSDADRKLVDRFLRAARRRKVHEGYIASSRRAWWSVGLRAPAPVLATYMARRPPAFVRNDVDARHINIAHGLYPRVELSPAVLDRLAAHLRAAVSLHQGRTYAGGLTKFEPKEMERLPVPSLEQLTDGAR